MKEFISGDIVTSTLYGGLTGIIIAKSKAYPHLYVIEVIECQNHTGWATEDFTVLKLNKNKGYLYIAPNDLEVAGTEEVEEC